VQQPCSNPSKSPELLRKASTQKYGCLQVFCKFQKSPANYLAAFTRQRSLVRTQHRPLSKIAVLQVKLCRNSRWLELPQWPCAATVQKTSTTLTLVYHDLTYTPAFEIFKMERLKLAPQ
jgi:hypothetical protein